MKNWKNLIEKMSKTNKAEELKDAQELTIVAAHSLTLHGMMKELAPRLVNFNGEDFTLYEYKTANTVDPCAFSDFLKGAKLAASSCEISAHWFNSDLIVRFDFDTINAKMRVFIPAVWNACKNFISYDAKVNKFGTPYRFQAVIPIGYYLENRGAVIDAFNGAAGMRAVRALKEGAVIFDTVEEKALFYAFNPFAVLEIPEQKYTDPRGWYFRECGK